MSYNINSALQGGNVTLSKAGLTGLSGAATTYSTGATAITYAVQGKMPTAKAQVSGGTTPTTDIVTGLTFSVLKANQGCAFVWCLDASGNIRVAQGPVPVQPGTVGTVTNVDDSGNFTAAPQFPQIPDTLTPFAYAIVRTTSSYVGTTGFRFGTDNWNTTGVATIAVQDVFTLPASPQTA
jgi:hypothetical protein